MPSLLGCGNVCEAEDSPQYDFQEPGPIVERVDSSSDTGDVETPAKKKVKAHPDIITPVKLTKSGHPKLRPASPQCCPSF